mmetsp:Transcript_24641/g.63995  ORF Transcript_24641/g.63995 Transcript_24641/m.63995 type:complete len:383 (+) Transcript_24641:1145-2293(+)
MLGGVGLRRYHPRTDHDRHAHPAGPVGGPLLRLHAPAGLRRVALVGQLHRHAGARVHRLREAHPRHGQRLLPGAHRNPAHRGNHGDVCVAGAAAVVRPRLLHGHRVDQRPDGIVLRVGRLRGGGDALGAARPGGGAAQGAPDAQPLCGALPRVHRADHEPHLPGGAPQDPGAGDAARGGGQDAGDRHRGVALPLSAQDGRRGGARAGAGGRVCVCAAQRGDADAAPTPPGLHDAPRSHRAVAAHHARAHEHLHRAHRERHRRGADAEDQHRGRAHGDGVDQGAAVPGRPAGRRGDDAHQPAVLPHAQPPQAPPRLVPGVHGPAAQAGQRGERCARGQIKQWRALGTRTSEGAVPQPLYAHRREGRTAVGAAGRYFGSQGCFA